MRKIRYIIGSISVIFGVSLLSLAYYGLKFIQLADKSTLGHYRTNPLKYSDTGSVGISLLLLKVLIVFGLLNLLWDPVKKYREQRKEDEQ